MTKTTEAALMAPFDSHHATLLVGRTTVDVPAGSLLAIGQGLDRRQWLVIVDAGDGVLEALAGLRIEAGEPQQPRNPSPIYRPVPTKNIGADH